jgi:hypothetical protein
VASTGPHDVREPAAHRLRAGVAFALLLLLLGVVAAASGGGETLTGKSRDLGVSQLLVDYVYTIAIVLAVAAVALFVVLIVLARGAPTAGPAISRRHMYAGFLVLLAAVAGYRAIRPPDPIEQEQRAPAPAQLEPADPQAEASPAEDRDPAFRWEVPLLVGGAAMVAALAYALRRRPPEDEPGAEDAAVALSTVLDEALDDLRAERDARRAVIAAYARLEQTLARHGLPRHPSEAPIEYLSRILLKLEVAPEAVLDLTDLFEQAKFSRRRIDAAMKEDAIGALVAVRDDLRAAA